MAEDPALANAVHPPSAKGGVAMSWAIIYDISSSILPVQYLVVEDPRELVANDRNLYELIGAPALYDHT